MIQSERIQILNQKPINQGNYILYWMQASQRAHWNHALELAVQYANDMNLPLVVYFGLIESYPNANLRHFSFMLQGLEHTRLELEKRGIQLVLRLESPDVGTIDLAHNAALLITDCGYLRHQKKWRQTVSKAVPCRMIQVETDVVVPTRQASNKQEYAARTIRPKIHKQLEKYLVPMSIKKLKTTSLQLTFKNKVIPPLTDLIDKLDVDRSVPASQHYIGGTDQAFCHLKRFATTALKKYSEKRNDPNQNVLSNMSPYLHFGQISPLLIALQIAKSPLPDKDKYLEELIVRRELAINYVNNARYYDSFSGLPRWAKATLKDHKKDPRVYTYSLKQLELAHTHDPYWNAAQMEMVKTGKMHGYMRMYWGKKIIEWTNDPTKAFKHALYLNDKYELDGRDPNGYTGVAWCFGLHDRPWTNRPIFGSIRYMNDQGLKRKFDADAYVQKVTSIPTS